MRLIDQIPKIALEKNLLLTEALELDNSIQSLQRKNT